ncbi:MAG: glycosyltransferase family 4 protein [Sulfurimonas sp.]|nr:glycosyltransferase family 4 protein [Sulfurimonas sp.]
MIYIILLILSFTLTYSIKNFYIKNAILEEVNERSSHTVAIPHGGGIAISLTWFLGLSYLFFTNDVETSLYYALMLGLLISVVSFFDDLFELSAKLRLIIQSIVAFSGLYFLGGFESFSFYFFSIENQIFTNIFAFFMIIWFINLYNFLDGIDGYAGSEAVFLGAAGFFLFGGSHFLVLVFAVLGFLVWNWHRAKIFMGDVGSTLLGYNIAIFTIYYANQESMNFWIWIVLFSVFWLDATYTLFRRYKAGKKLSQAHKEHIYQKLTQSGYSHDKVVLLAMFINCIIFILIYISCDIIL